MDVKYALRVLGINNLYDISDEELKKRYRMVIKKNHPDIGGKTSTASDINIAYRTLKEVRKKTVNQQNKNRSNICIINLCDLCDIYKGNSVKCDNSSNIVNKNNYRQFNLLLNIDVCLDVCGLERNYNSISIINNNDSYSIGCKVASIDNSSIPIKIKAYNKEMSVMLTGNRITAAFVFDFNVKLSVIVERQLIKNEI